MKLHCKGQTTKYYLQEQTIRNMPKKYQSVICTQRHHTMKILYGYINSSLCHNIVILITFKKATLNLTLKTLMKIRSILHK